MCAILGVQLNNPTKDQIEIIKRLFIESQIRGRHASGLSILTNGKPWSYVTPNPAEYLVEKFNWSCALSQSKLVLIGHTRYSTSDLRYNQPLSSEEIAIAHNGVVTQDSPEMWNRYGYELNTTNDSELVLRSLIAGNEPMEEFPDASMAVCELSERKGVRWWRNGTRPLYAVKVDNGYFICSTADIAKRAGLNGAKKCVPGTIYTPSGKTKLLTLEEFVL